MRPVPFRRTTQHPHPVAVAQRLELDVLRLHKGLSGDDEQKNAEERGNETTDLSQPGHMVDDHQSPGIRRDTSAELLPDRPPPRISPDSRAARVRPYAGRKVLRPTAPAGQACIPSEPYLRGRCGPFLRLGPGCVRRPGPSHQGVPERRRHTTRAVPSWLWRANTVAATLSSIRLAAWEGNAAHGGGQAEADRSFARPRPDHHAVPRCTALRRRRVPPEWNVRDLLRHAGGVARLHP